MWLPATASGLIIDNVRSMAMLNSFKIEGDYDFKYEKL